MAKTLNIKTVVLFVLISIIFSNLETHAAARLSGNIFAYGSEPFIAVVVNKSKNKLYIVEVKDDKPEIIAETTVLVGGGGGDKLVSGDMKTPEGVYTITNYLSPEVLRKSYGNSADDYGTGAFTLNYPNFFDRIRGKTGGGIWIHGKRVDRKEQNTRGCVALENDTLDQYKKYLKVGVPVVITDKIDFDQISSYSFDRSFLKEKLDTLIASWKGLDFENFASYYHIKFKSNSGESYTEYLRKKKVLMSLYPERKIDIYNIRAFKENDDEFVYDFDQLYCADNLLTYGRKKLYLKKEVDDLKIIAEEFSSSSYEPIVKKEVTEFLNNWAKAWENKDINSYMSRYANDFSVAGFNYAQWKADKEDKFSRLTSIKVGIDNINISQVSPKKVRVSFTQNYSGDSFSDKGIKTLELVGCPGDYRIKSELWRAK